ncbi:unnamed protein product [Rotaria sp. Silwood2]|nr:unnamed protein product [Rotaria sp. Silwood2]
MTNTIETEEALLHEIAFSCPLAYMHYLISVYGSVRLPQYDIGIIMKYINGSSLAAALNDKSTIIHNFSIRERLEITLGIAKGLVELYLVYIVHRDFKVENVLLFQSSNGSYISKIANFDLSYQLAIVSATFVKDFGGTVGYDVLEIVRYIFFSFYSLRTFGNQMYFYWYEIGMNSGKVHYAL